jgi:hypothetical protein
MAYSLLGIWCHDSSFRALFMQMRPRVLWIQFPALRKDWKPVSVFMSRNQNVRQISENWTGYMPHVEAGLNTSTVTLRVIEGDENGTRCLGGHPVSGGHKYRDLVIQVGGWTQGWRPCSVKKLLLRNPKKWKLDGLIEDKSGRIFKGRLWLKKMAVLQMMMNWLYKPL